MTELEKLFAKKQTENGDVSYNTTGNNLLDILFMTSYFEKHLDKVNIGQTEKEKIFARFIRDPRFGLGRRDLGRRLMKLAKVEPSDIIKSGRYDDLWNIPSEENIALLKIALNDRSVDKELAKKWMPRLNSKNKDAAKILCKEFGLTEKQYRKLIKCDTTENKLSRHRTNEINFEQVPSLAMIKYYNRFANGEDTKDRFEKYLEGVKKGTKELKIKTTNIYDIYKNRDKIDADLFFDKLEKISINCIPILDTSGSMWDDNDSIGKACSIAYYLAKCSNYANNQVISFSSKPRLIKIQEKEEVKSNYWYRNELFGNKNKFSREINSMYTGDCSNTDFGAVMRILKDLKEFPEYIIVLSDMEFDVGSNQSKNELQRLWKENNCKTKLIWWNFNSRNTTVPELDENGNVYISGYSPMLLKYLETGFDGNKFLDKLLEEYEKNVL